MRSAAPGSKGTDHDCDQDYDRRDAEHVQQEAERLALGADRIDHNR
jgi:hypothetical protein